MTRGLVCSLFLVVWLLGPGLVGGQNTVGLITNDGRAQEGFTLFVPLIFPTAYLIDNDGQLINAWQSPFSNGGDHHLLENGHLLRPANRRQNTVFRAGGAGGLIQEMDWDGTIVWEFEYDTDRVLQHHDIEPLPNGNILMIAWELKTREEAIEAGRDPAFTPGTGLWPEHIIEVQPTRPNGGQIVWEWHMWDHLVQDYDSTKNNFGVVADHPELLDINFQEGVATSGSDFIHANSIDYNPHLDQIVIGSKTYSEFWIIDHSTTTEEAAGHTGGNSGKGGDILYRWGNPRAYRVGGSEDRKLFGQHNVQWIENGLAGGGHILLFNNGDDRPGEAFSEIIELVPPRDSTGYLRAPGKAFGPAEPAWRYTAPTRTDFYSQIVSGVQRLPNGNTLIATGDTGTLFEVTPESETVWHYVSPVVPTGPLNQGDDPTLKDNRVWRAWRFPPDYPAFDGRAMTPQGPIEKPLGTAVEETPPGIVDAFLVSPGYPNPSPGRSVIKIDLTTPSHVTVQVFDALGRRVATLLDDTLPSGTHRAVFEAGSLPNGTYFYRVATGERRATGSIVLAR